jgi:C4-dicarboxylate-specific signal transduction histidine kinase
VSWVLAAGGWSVVAVLLVIVRARLSRVADAEHELRGAVTAIGLAADRMHRVGATRGFTSLVALQVDRMEAAVQDLGRARDLRPGPARAGSAASSRSAPRIDVGRLSQVVANLVDNAAEHGAGPVDVRWSATRAGARLEIRNRNAKVAGAGPGALDGVSAERRAGRGRGLGIASRAARDLGGNLRVESDDEATVATLELPPVDGGHSRAA